MGSSRRGRFTLDASLFRSHLAPGIHPTISTAKRDWRLDASGVIGVDTWQSRPLRSLASIRLYSTVAKDAPEYQATIPRRETGGI